MSDPRVVVFYVDAGGGHRSATRALSAAAEERGCAWHFEPVNFQALVARLDFTRRLTSLSAEELYNFLLRHRLTWTLEPLLRILQGIIRVRYRALVRHAQDYLARLDPRPALVLSAFPNFNGVLRDACRAALPGVPFAVLVTDLADFPPHFWIEPGIDCLIVGSDEAACQARRLGLGDDAVVRVSGMVLHPRFHAASPAGLRATMRSELGFGIDDFVVLLLFGGQGSPEMLPIARGLLDASTGWRVIAIGGKNPTLVARLESLARERPGRLHVTGFTERVADFMATADLLVTKPGPGSLAEAWHRQVPAVVVGNRRTIPQERFNVRLLSERELGIAVASWHAIPAAVSAYVADAPRRERIRRNLAALPPNRAVYEVLDAIAARLTREPIAR